MMKPGPANTALCSLGILCQVWCQCFWHVKRIYEFLETGEILFFWWGAHLWMNSPKWRQERSAEEEESEKVRKIGWGGGGRGGESQTQLHVNHPHCSPNAREQRISGRKSRFLVPVLACPSQGWSLMLIIPFFPPNSWKRHPHICLSGSDGHQLITNTHPTLTYIYSIYIYSRHLISMQLFRWLWIAGC